MCWRGWNWNQLEPELGMECLQVIENKVARDGIEPPTPAFSGLDSADPIVLISHVLTTFSTFPTIEFLGPYWDQSSIHK